MAKLKAETLETIEDVKNETIDKIDCLCALLESQVIDDDKNGGYGTETVFQNAFNPSERAKIKTKIFKLIDEL